MQRRYRKKPVQLSLIHIYTMAYTASALSYMLQNLCKPVVLTGAQIPIERMFTDAKRNLQTAFAAVNAGVEGVTIAFDDKIINGCRAVKVRTLGFNAFESISAPYLGEVYADGIHVYAHLSLIHICFCGFCFI